MKRWQTALRLIGVGWYIGICIAGGVLGGLALDSKLQTMPIFSIIGLILGIALAFYGVYRMILPLNKNDKGKD